MNYAVFALHRGSNGGIVEKCRVANREIAQAIADKLREETFIDRPPNEKRGRSVPRYAQVYVEEVS